ncbi:MAG: nicotinate-nicotinamide nucleotide adenylyltransferase [Anaerotruncus massiliensis (ex Togo et al. 2019)]
MRTGVFGGTFNPVTTATSTWRAPILTRSGSTGCWSSPPACLPTSQEQLANGADRLAMCRLAFDACRLRGERHRAAARAEKLHGGHPRAACEEYPDDGFYLIMGSDMFLTLTGWRSGGASASWRLSAPGRGTPRCAAGSPTATLARGAGGALRAGRATPSDLLALVRGRAREKKTLGGLVPPKVAAYIDSHGLYQTL